MALHLGPFDQIMAAIILAGQRETGATIEMLMGQVIVEPFLAAVRAGVGSFDTLALVAGVCGSLDQLPTPIATEQRLVLAVFQVGHHHALLHRRQALLVGTREGQIGAVHEVIRGEKVVDTLRATVGTDKGPFGTLGLDMGVKDTTDHLLLAKSTGNDLVWTLSFQMLL